MKLLLIILAGICFSIQILAQEDTLRIFFVPTMGEKVINLLESDQALRNDSLEIVIDKFLFYASQFQLLNDSIPVFEERNSFHLINASEPGSLFIDLLISQELVFNKLQFSVGIDSLTNVSGAMGGDLDPTKGMYWTWQSGYINFKLEGRSLQCPSRKNQFQFHIGGYQKPCYPIQEITLPLGDSRNKRELIVYIDLSKFLEQIVLSETYEVMSPTAEAFELSHLLAKIYSLNK